MELLAFGDTGWGDELFYATLMTIAVSITAMLIGFLFALIFTPLKLSKYKSLNLIGNFYTTVIRGVPELLVIYLFFFGGSGAIMFVASMFGYYEYIEINAFITGSFAIGIISGVGDRRNEDIIECAKIAARMFDHIIIRQEKHLRGRTEQEIIDLILQGIKEENKQVTHEVISLEIDAIKHAISIAEEGTFITALSDVVDNAIETVQSYLDAEIEAEKK